MKNKTIAKDTKHVEQLQHQNDTLLKVLSRMYEGNKHLGLLIKGCKHPFDRRGLGFKDKITHYVSKYKFIPFVKANEVDSSNAFNSKMKKMPKT